MRVVPAGWVDSHCGGAPLLAGAVAEVINNQQYELAEAYLSNDTQLAHSSEEIATAILRLEAATRA